MGLGKALIGDVKHVEGKKILVLDWQNQAFRFLHVAHANNPLDLEWLDWQYFMINMVYGYVRKFKPDQLIICNDLGGNWRKDVYPEYKGTRKKGRDESPIDFDSFFAAAKPFYEGIKEMFTNVYFMGKEGYEADDFIGVIVKELAGNDITVVTTDKDMYQLHKHKGYKQFNPIKKQYVKVMGSPVKFAEKELFVKLLTGDSSDNIPQVKKKMGPKTAEKYMDKLEELLSEDIEIRQKYELNKRLIDMEMIPKEIQEDIKDIYYNYEFSPYSGRKVYDYLANRLPKTLSYIQEINGAFTGLKSYEELQR
jgi:5'-3' exonuclease